MATANHFSGRCEAYRVAKEVDSAGVAASVVNGLLARCQAWEEGAIGFSRMNHWADPAIAYGWTATPERHRLAMRLFASAMDSDFRAAACEAAVAMPEARDIPESKGFDRATTR